jgi:two-component SAPR family response regulator
MYRGDYLADSDYWWAESERQRLRQLWLKLTQQLAGFYEREQLPDEAIRMYRGILRLDPLQEDGHFALMRLYAQLEQRTAVEEQYRELTAVLDRELAIGPNRKIVEWYDRWKVGALQK